MNDNQVNLKEIKLFKSYADSHGYTRMSIYPWTQKFLDKLRGFPENSLREVYCKRIFKGLKPQWIMLSKKITKLGKMTTRESRILYFITIEYRSDPLNPPGVFRITFVNLEGLYDTQTVSALDLVDLVFRIEGDQESLAYSKILDSLLESPDPIHEAMWLDYGGDYEKYKKDCRKYGYKILPKVIIENSKAFAISPDGQCLGDWDPDYKYINI